MVFSERWVVHASRVLVIASRDHGLSCDATNTQRIVSALKRLFRRDAKTSARDARATRASERGRSLSSRGLREVCLSAGRGRHSAETEVMPYGVGGAPRS
jgi:hypothetical protein